MSDVLTRVPQNFRTPAFLFCAVLCLILRSLLIGSVPRPVGLHPARGGLARALQRLWLLSIFMSNQQEVEIFPKIFMIHYCTLIGLSNNS